MNKAKALADQVTTLRTFYTAQVVSRAKEVGMKVNYDWENEPFTLPLPATFTNVLGKEIQKAKPWNDYPSLQSVPISSSERD